MTNLGLLFGIISFTGCAGIHFYNSDNDAAASLAKKTSDEVDLKLVIEAERKNQVKLLDHELEIVAQAALAKRNTMLRGLLEDRNKPGSPEVQSLSHKQEQMINTRLSELTGQKPEELFNAIKKFDTELENFNTATDLFDRQLPISAPECKIGTDTDKIELDITNEMIALYTKAAESIGSHANVENLLEIYKKSCEKYLETWKAVANSGGIFSDIAKEEYEAVKNLAAQETTAQKLENDYINALKEYNETLKQAEINVSETTKKAIKDQTEKLKSALNALKGTGIFGKKIAAKLQIEKIDLILYVLAKGKLDEEKLKCSDIKFEKEKNKCLKTKQALGVVAQLPSFAGRLATIDALTKLPPVNTLLFEKERLMALKTDAETQIGRTLSKISLLKQKRNAAFDEIESLMMARQHLNWARQKNNNLEIKLSDLYKNSINESARRHMVIAITRYLNTSTGPQRFMHEIKYRLLDIEHAQALDASETALRLWEVAIKQPVNVLASYHGSGMKKEELAKLAIEALKAAGLFAIAGGVLK